MLKDIIESTKLDPKFCASLLCVTEEQFAEWMDGRSPIPRFALSPLSSILGVPAKVLVSQAVSASLPDSGILAPAIWYKLRDETLSDADRELVGLVRKLGFSSSQLQQIKGQRNYQFRSVFDCIREQVDKSEPPVLQGRKAAEAFRSLTDFQNGQNGIGHLIREKLRRYGIVIIESPLKNSTIEGCAFTVGSETSTQPCLFANSYRSTWFRRNYILMHELGHAIFDIPDDQVTIDHKADESQELHEIRAQAFGQESLVPRSVLIQIQNRYGFKWDGLAANDLAQLVAQSEVEQGLVLKAAFDARLINSDQREQYSRLDCAAIIKEMTPRALSTKEFLKQHAVHSPMWIAENRTTETGVRRLRLPSPFVKTVLEAFNEGEISLGKVAEMLMMSRRTVEARFGQELKVAS
jgi:Zn-dependent peptidase ImmA (M78 family)